MVGILIIKGCSDTGIIHAQTVPQEMKSHCSKGAAMADNKTASTALRLSVAESGSMGNS
jgi:hypothetical protein